MQGVVETGPYLAAAKDAGLSDDDRTGIVDAVAATPAGGDVIPGTGGCRKIRFAGRGKGKSGGHRVITFFGGEAMPVFLLTIYGKGDRANITPAERNTMARLTASIAASYRRRAERQ